jgi:hypothetical protein
MCPQHVTWWVLPMDRFFHCTDMDTRLPTKWKTFVGNRVAKIQEETFAVSWRHVPTESNPADLISRGINPTIVYTSTLWWNWPQWLLQEPFFWPAMNFNGSAENMEIRNVHVDRLQPQEDITQRFSKLNRLVRVVAYCRRLIHNCRHSNANLITTTLTTQELNQALTCCVKIVQQISYAQEKRELMEQQEVTSTNSLRTLHPFVDP